MAKKTGLGLIRLMEMNFEGTHQLHPLRRHFEQIMS